MYLEGNCVGYVGKSREEFGMEGAMTRNTGEKVLEELRQAMNIGSGMEIIIHLSVNESLEFNSDLL